MKKTLQGRTILVTRPAAQAGKLAGMIADLGGEALCFPLLEISPAEDVAPVRAAGERLEAYALAVFISPNAVEYGLPHLLAGRTGWPAGVQPAAVGPSTVAALAARGVEGAIAPSGRFDSEALLALPFLQPQRVAGKRALILRGNGGRELLAETLRERGAAVDCVICYRRSPPRDTTLLLDWLRSGRLDAIAVSSSEGLRHLLDLLDAAARRQLSGLPLLVPHARIAEQALALGLRHVVPTAPADAGIVESLRTFDWEMGTVQGKVQGAVQGTAQERVREVRESVPVEGVRSVPVAPPG